jgi:uncharacterized membrane protein YccC
VVELFWVATAWPNGASAIVFAAILVLLLSPKGDLAFGGSIAFVIGTGTAVICAALIKFAVLPGLDTFSSLLPGPRSLFHTNRFWCGPSPPAGNVRRVHRHGL